MISIQARNAHQALPMGVAAVLKHGQEQPSRNGRVSRIPVPYMTTYARPMERVIFHPERDAHPFFHFFEALWMLNGGEDVATVSQFVPRMREFSDDGHRFHGAYGYRWRHHFEKDQLLTIIDQLAKDPYDRRNVLAMWDARTDLSTVSKDLPCNTHVYFSSDTPGAQLSMTVCNRSNDMVWGTYGANAVHLSMLHEVIATGAGFKVGDYHQFSNNTHVYLDLPVVARTLELANIFNSDPYVDGQVEPYPMFTEFHGDICQWFRELSVFMTMVSAPGHLDLLGFRFPFFRRVAVPMLAAWAEYINPDLTPLEQCQAAYAKAMEVQASDWRLAVGQWLKRRHDGRKAKLARVANDDGVQYE